MTASPLSSSFLSPPNLIKQLTKLPVCGWVPLFGESPVIHNKVLTAREATNRRLELVKRIFNSINPGQAKHVAKVKP